MYLVSQEGDIDSIMGLSKELTEKLFHEVLSLQYIGNQSNGIQLS